MPVDPDCRRCKLHQGRTQVVFPTGDTSSPLLLIGEGPGEREDRTGTPFVGRAGIWLDRCFQEAGLERRKVLITNTVRCRPPKNRRPENDEIETCRPYLLEEMAGRMLIVPLGATATGNLLGRKVVMSEVANRFHTIELSGVSYLIMPTYHPSACIYNNNARVRLTEGLRMAKEHCHLT